jgi:putative flippase GtrA
VSNTAERTSEAVPNPSRSVRSRTVALELLGYGLASAVALAADAATLRTLVVICHWYYLPASAIAFIAGAAVAYVLSVRFVFRSRRVTNSTREFAFFLVLGIVGLLINAAVISLAISGFGLGLLTAKACAAVCTFISNFALRRALLFAPKRNS